jgi:glycosyltransferase involved in cell wall biosynthesis
VKFLFIHQNFPGQFLHIVRHLLGQQEHEIVFLTEPNPNQIVGVRKVPYRKPDPPPADTHWVAREFEQACRRAEIVARTAASLKGLGFIPDIIMGHHGWGELLNLRDIWPQSPLLGYLEFFYHTEGVDVGFDPEFPNHAADAPRVRAKNAVNLIALNLGAHGQTPTEWQLSTYPAWAHEQISVLREGVDLETCSPAPAVRRETLKIGEFEIGPRDRLVTYVARDLEPYRGFHILMRSLPDLLRARKDVRVVIVGGDGVSYGAAPQTGTWKQLFLDEVGSRLDMSRLCLPGKVDYKTYLRLLQRSDAHIYLTYPFVASWSLREALAVGCAVIGSDTAPVREFIKHRSNGLLVPFFEPKALAQAVLEILDDNELSKRLRTGARRYAERYLSLADTLAGYERLIGQLTGNEVRAPALA